MANGSNRDVTANSTAVTGGLLRDLLAGLIASIVIIAYAMSYAALILPGPYAVGVPQLTWAMLVGSFAVGLLIAFFTTLPPMGGGLDTPQTAAMILFGASIAAGATAAGHDPATSARYVMLALSLTTVLIAMIKLAIGCFRLTGSFRLVPYGVVAGFTTATGILLVFGGYSLATGRAATLANFTSPMQDDMGLRLALALGFAILLQTLRRKIKTPYLLPVSFIAAALAVDVALYLADGALAARPGWFLGGLRQAEPWLPLNMLLDPATDRSFLVQFIPDAIAVAIVANISLIVKLISVETQRGQSADADAEFRLTGVANLAVAPFGGMSSSVLLSPTRLLTDAGGTGWRPGAFAAGIVGCVALLKIDLPGVVPLPVLGGLIFALGWSMAIDSVKRFAAQKDWWTLSFAATVAAVCVAIGYIPGILLGFLASCLMFAAAYAKVGVVRSATTRTSITSNVDHGHAAMALLADKGDAIRIYRLTEFIFFGSSDALFERIRSDIVAPSGGLAARFLVLDFTRVTGVDASAIVSLGKLRSLADGRRIGLVFTGLDECTERALATDGMFNESRAHRRFDDFDDGLAWAEAQVVAVEAGKITDGAEPTVDAFVSWLTREPRPLRARAVSSGTSSACQREEAGLASPSIAAR
jgi:sulfate permease, SulP family